MSTFDTFDNQTGKLPPQFLLQQRYLIVGVAGKGGMGSVYQAIDTHRANRRMAIKEMSQGHLSDVELGQATAQFQREAAMLGSLSHPNLPHIYGAFNERGRSYLVMDFIDGKTLLQLLKGSGFRPLPVSQVLAYAHQLCDVLTYLHQHQPPIIFRDLKPTNVMATATGDVFLIDFGIARVFKEGQQQDTILLGSPGYAPPEQHGSSQTNPRSDLYSLGATLHCCLTGRDPYHAADRFTFPPVRQYNPEVPVELEQLIQRLVALDERQRPASALEVQQVLTKISQQRAKTSEESTPAVTAASAPTQYVSPAVATPPTQYVPSAANANKGPLILPPTAAMAPLAAASDRGSPQAPLTQTSSFARIWTPSFRIVFGLLLLLTLGGSIVAFNIPHPYGPNNPAGLDHAVEFGLSLLLLLVAIVVSRRVSDLIPRGILSLTALGIGFSGFAFAVQTLNDILQQLPASLQQADPNQILTIGPVAVSVVSLLWVVRPFVLIDRIILLVLFGVATICALMQSGATDGDLSKHILLLIVLIALTLGTLVVIQMERVRERSR